MRIFVINPNSSVHVTDHVRETLEKIKRPDTELFVTCPEHGPISIESAYDEARAAYHILPLVQKALRHIDLNIADSEKALIAYETVFHVSNGITIHNLMDTERIEKCLSESHGEEISCRISTCVSHFQLAGSRANRMAT